MKSILQLIVLALLIGLSVPALSANEIPPGQPFKSLLERTEALEANYERLEANYSEIMVLLQELKEWVERNQATKAELQAAIEETMDTLQTGLSEIMEQLDMVSQTANIGISEIQVQLDTITDLELGERLIDMEDKMACISDESDRFDLLFQGCNVHVRNTGGRTDIIDGFGNLIIGYNEDVSKETEDRTGSHNLIIGSDHTYSSFGGLVAGFSNSVTNEFATVTGGALNESIGPASSISGGQGNTASGLTSSVSGGSGCDSSKMGSWGVGSELEAGCVLTNLP